MKHPELLAPAGSMEGVRAAVQSGADAVYMGFGTFHARRGAKNFDQEEMAQAIAYCRARGVKTNITFNIVATDRERAQALQDAHFLVQAGADALIVQDLGLARQLRHHAPALALHASTQMTVHTLDGALFAKEQGFSRVVLARECSLEQIKHITAHAGIETEVFVHGALCMCYSGQCYFSAMLGQRSGNRGMCAQPCRLAYQYDNGRTDYPLSLKDLSLAQWVGALADAGVSSLKIEGRMKRAEYAAVVTQVFADLLAQGKKPTAEQQRLLQLVFSRDGFTDGYMTGHKGDAMFGTKSEVPLHEVQDVYTQAANRFAVGKELPRVPISLALSACADKPLTLTACDDIHTVTVTADAPTVAHTRASSVDDVKKQLSKTGGTPFAVQQIDVTLAPMLLLPASVLNHLRRDALQQLLHLRSAPPPHIWMDASTPAIPKQQASFDGYVVEVRALEQVTTHLLEAKPAALYAPLSVLAEDIARTQQLCRTLPVAAVLPRIYADTQQQALENELAAVQAAGVQAVVAGNVGHMPLLRRTGLAIYGDFGLNITNSDALVAMQQAGIVRQTLSIELLLAQVRDMQKPIDTELIVYGYLPLMVFENCIICRKEGKCNCKEKPCFLKDRKGKTFQLLPEYGCRNTLLNSQPLYLPHAQEYTRLGVRYGRLRFTTESPTRCAEILRAYQQGESLVFTEGTTKGLYFRGII